MAVVDNRCKGADRECELIRALLPTFPAAHRNLDQARESSGRDILKVPGYCLQLKAGRAPSRRKALAEAQGAAETGEISVGITRDDRGPFVAHVLLEDPLGLIEGRAS